MTGTIRRVFEDKFYGFISGDGTSAGSNRDFFFHRSGLDESLEFSGQLVELRVNFETLDSDRGPKAINVRAAA